ncbi:MAG: efflux RND transporter periplasmic adaptor subunit [Deltaproteobacteria bacterium]|nr:efflux RND transporter periplasmic adaptor subunit [Deltaproteobacteria bacterium]
MIRIIKYISLFVFVLFSGCTAEDPETTDEIVFAPVHVVAVQNQKKDEQYNLIGTIEINREMKVGFKLAGKVTQLTFEQGQWIEKGTLLAQLDTTELLAQKEKVLENRSKTKRDLERMEKLFKQKIVPESSLQDAQSAYNLSGAELKIIEDALKNSTIMAPFSGKIIQKFAEEGEVVGAGIPIALLAEMDPILVKAAIPDYLIPKIHVGDDAVIKVDWEPGRRFPGTIRRIEPLADPITRTIRVEILVANPRETLKPGLMAQVEITHHANEASIYLSLDAVMGLGKAPFVFVVQDLNAVKREIETGKILQDEVEIIKGLSPGDTVVVSGQEYLRDQQPVIIKVEGDVNP